MSPCQRGTRIENKKQLLSFSVSLSRLLFLCVYVCSRSCVGCVSGYMHVCRHVCVHVCLSVCLSKRVKSQSWVLFLRNCSPVVFETGHLTVAWGRWLPRLTHQGTLPSQCWDCRCLLPYLPFYFSFGDQTLHAYFKHLTDHAVCLALGLYFQSVAFSALGSRSRM